jgi:two-component system sensor histidine kinase RegB
LATTFGLPRLDLPLDHIAWLILADATANAVGARLLSGRGGAVRWVATIALAIQVLLITALLELTGGPSNPFVLVYALQVTLAALTIGTLPSVTIGLFAMASYGVLIYWHVHELVPTHHRLNDFPTHLFTMWIAGAVTAELVAYFVGRASEALARREEALEAMRLRAARSERLVSVTTLAAGTAHELSTPLATIATAARELQRALETRRADEELTDDARLIRGEVDRCQAILDQMSGRAGGSSADEPELVAIPQVLDDVRSRLTAERAGRLVVHAAPNLRPVIVPRAGLSQALASLIANAFDATENVEFPVIVDVSATPDTFRVAISDQGSGLSSEALRRVGEPFFTTKEAGRGLGLGLFLARVFAERLGGSLKLESSVGTTAVLELDATTRVVVLTGYGSIATAVDSVKLGATSYLTKPVDADQILAAFEGTESTERSEPTAQPLARVEWEHIQRVLADCGGNLSRAARVLGIHRRSLQRKLSKNPVPEAD